VATPSAALAAANGAGAGAGPASGDLLAVPGPYRKHQNLRKHVQFPDPSDINHSESSDNAGMTTGGKMPY